MRLGSRGRHRVQLLLLHKSLHLGGHRPGDGVLDDDAAAPRGGHCAGRETRRPGPQPRRRAA
eukprot:5455992-Heterocapsa_arctica.AAC.1